MMDVISLLLIILPGMVGGLTRGLVGIAKHVYMKKERFHILKLLFSLLVAAIVGGIASVLTEGDWRIALIAGYAGSDFIESLYKSKLFGVLR